MVPCGEPTDPFRNRCATITGAVLVVVPVVVTAASSPSVSRPISGARQASAARNRDAIASSWRMWPKVKLRRNDPSVDGA
ncbi:hypothetical protein GCM10009789_43600 [Kribbella sancticallisti]|uniref:Secreted protein n=1 Tax=Kribbella sancticallisti TaxID=460087 RepID=A0ABN2DUI0_9ACTN